MKQTEKLTTESTEARGARETRKLKKLLFVSVLSVCSVVLSSCFAANDLPIVQRFVDNRQKQKIASLQKKLESAEDEVEKLAAKINDIHLAFIRRQVDLAEKKKTPSMFLAERETLYQIIQSGPSPSSFEAQVELERILRIITEFSDEGQNG